MSNTPNVDVLLQPFTLNRKLTLQNRVVMAPMTRSMADDNLVPTAAMAAYYARRAEAGLIITEATIVRPDGQGYPNTPGIFNADQISGWQEVTKAVHAKGGKIFVQLWHVGRVSHPVYLNGNAPIAPSAVPLNGRVPRSDNLQYGTPRALETHELPALVEAFALAASNALEANFDGVEIHGANAYLIDQFLHYHTNRRTDAYGGSAENMVRFPLEIVDAVLSRVGAEQLGIRLSPAAYINMETNPNDVAVFQHLLSELNKRQLAYVHAGIFDDSAQFDYLDGSVSQFLRRHYNGTVIGSGGYTPETAAQAITQQTFDQVAIGRPFIANPDWVNKVRQKQPLVPYNEAMLAELN